MRVLIGNTVKTDVSDYHFGSREEAEGFYMTLKVERGAGQKAARPAGHSGSGPKRSRRASGVK